MTLSKEKLMATAAAAAVSVYAPGGAITRAVLAYATYELAQKALKPAPSLLEDQPNLTQPITRLANGVRGRRLGAPCACQH